MVAGRGPSDKAEANGRSQPNACVHFDEVLATKLGVDPCWPMAGLEVANCACLLLQCAWCRPSNPNVVRPHLVITRSPRCRLDFSHAVVHCLELSAPEWPQSGDQLISRYARFGSRLCGNALRRPARSI